MRHRVAGRKLGRQSQHRRAMWRNMAAALFTHGQITTTLAKAKSVKPFVEKLITAAKKGDLASRRRVISSMGFDRIMVADEDDEELIRSNTRPNRPEGYQGKLLGGPKLVKHLFEEIAPRYADRPGGYTRIIKLGRHRIGDGGDLCVLQLVGQEQGGPQLTGQYSRRRDKANHRMKVAARLRRGKPASGAAASSEAASSQPADSSSGAEAETAASASAPSPEAGRQEQSFAHAPDTSETVEQSRGGQVAQPGDESGGPSSDEPHT